MTRASLLRILDHVNGISDDEIRELEQLAAAFPYCQTAHVLLAKTAHDRGSMLAGQRLRRAATYAADRELLRQLLERPAPEARTVEARVADTPQPDAVAAAEAPPTAPVALAAEALAEPATALETDLFAVEAVSAPAPADETAVADEPAGQELLTPTEAPANAQHTTVADTTPTATEPTTAHEPAAEPAAAEPVVSPKTAPAELLEAKNPASEVRPASAEGAAGPVGPLATPSATTGAADATDASDEAPPEAAVAEEAPAPTATSAPEPADELLPAVAPPVRPPSGAGISRFEFGLGESRLPEPTGYRLPGFDEDEDAFVAEDDELPTSRPPASPRITAPFRADAELGYALGGGSRLGYDLQGRTPDGFTLDLPLEAFFEPDALLLAHARAHQPAPKTSSLDLINRFLKAQPRIKAGGTGAAPPAAEQADLSVRSSNAAPALASESLAKIMVRQGKTAKAIEIYERLMAKQPEKMAYFAQQIQQLQQPPE